MATSLALFPLLQQLLHQPRRGSRTHAAFFTSSQSTGGFVSNAGDNAMVMDMGIDVDTGKEILMVEHNT